VLNVYWPEIPKDYHIDFLTRSESRYVRLMAFDKRYRGDCDIAATQNRAIAKTGVGVHLPGNIRRSHGTISVNASANIWLMQS
jgi:hypothetical protein